MVRASASQSVDLGFIFQLKSMVFTTSLVGAQHKKESEQNKLASLLVSLDKTFNGMSHFNVAGR